MRFRNLISSLLVFITLGGQAWAQSYKLPSTVDAGGARISASGNRQLSDKLRDTTTPKDAYAICDGTSHPLSATFSTLALAQAQYPAATALSDETDWAAMQSALNSVNQLTLTNNTCVVNRSLILNSNNNIIGSGAGVSNLLALPSNGQTVVNYPLIATGSIGGTSTVSNIILSNFTENGGEPANGTNLYPGISNAHGIYFASGTSNVQISNIEVTNNFGDGIYVYASTSVMINNNTYVHSNWQHGIYTVGNFNNNSPVYTSRLSIVGNRVIKNSLYNYPTGTTLNGIGSVWNPNPTGSSVTSYYGIYLDGLHNTSTVTNNYVRLNAIYLNEPETYTYNSNTYNLTSVNDNVSSNVVENSLQGGVTLNGALQHITVDSNKFINITEPVGFTSGSATHGCGAAVGPVVDIFYTNNVCNGFTGTSGTALPNDTITGNGAPSFGFYANANASGDTTPPTTLVINNNQFLDVSRTSNTGTNAPFSLIDIRGLATSVIIRNDVLQDDRTSANGAPYGVDTYNAGAGAEVSMVTAFAGSTGNFHFKTSDFVNPAGSTFALIDPTTGKLESAQTPSASTPQIIGDISVAGGSTGGSSLTATLPTVLMSGGSAETPGTYTKFTVNGKGLITNATTLTLQDLEGYSGESTDAPTFLADIGAAPSLSPIFTGTAKSADINNNATNSAIVTSNYLNTLGYFNNANLALANTTPLGLSNSRNLSAKLADTLSLKDFGAICDGNSHPLSNNYGTVNAAIAAFPYITNTYNNYQNFLPALTDEQDWIALQQAVTYVSLLNSNSNITGATITATLSSGVITALNYSGTAGSGGTPGTYALFFSDSTGYGAVATYTVGSGGVITATNLISGGTAYTSPTTKLNSITYYQLAIPASTCVINRRIVVGKNVVVAGAGLGQSIIKLEPQSGFTNPGAIAGVLMTSTISGGVVTSLSVVNAGVQGIPGTYSLVFSGGGGNGAAGTYTINTSGVVSATNITAGGTGYATAPTVTTVGGKNYADYDGFDVGQWVNGATVLAGDNSLFKNFTIQGTSSHAFDPIVVTSTNTQSTGTEGITPSSYSNIMNGVYANNDNPSIIPGLPIFGPGISLHAQVACTTNSSGVCTGQLYPNWKFNRTISPPLPVGSVIVIGGMISSHGGTGINVAPNTFNTTIDNVESLGNSARGIETDGISGKVSNSYIHNNWNAGIGSQGTYDQVVGITRASKNEIKSNKVYFNAQYNYFTTNGPLAAANANFIYGGITDQTGVSYQKGWDGIGINELSDTAMVHDNIMRGNDIIVFEPCSDGVGNEAASFALNQPISVGNGKCENIGDYGTHIYNNTLLDNSGGIDLTGWLYSTLVENNQVTNNQAQSDNINSACFYNNVASVGDANIVIRNNNCHDNTYPYGYYFQVYNINTNGTTAIASGVSLVGNDCFNSGDNAGITGTSGTCFYVGAGIGNVKIIGGTIEDTRSQQIASLSLTAAGSSGITAGTYPLNFFGGNGNGAIGTYTIAGNGTISAVNLISGGNNYTAAPTPAFNSNITGATLSVTMNTAGTGVQSVTATAAGTNGIPGTYALFFSGSGCTGISGNYTVGATGSIVSTLIIAQGTGCTGTPTTSLSNGNTTASASATLGVSGMYYDIDTSTSNGKNLITNVYMNPGISGVVNASATDSQINNFNNPTDIKFVTSTTLSSVSADLYANIGIYPGKLGALFFAVDQGFIYQGQSGGGWTVVPPEWSTSGDVYNGTGAASTQLILKAQPGLNNGTYNSVTTTSKGVITAGTVVTPGKMLNGTKPALQSSTIRKIPMLYSHNIGGNGTNTDNGGTSRLMFRTPYAIHDPSAIFMNYNETNGAESIAPNNNLTLQATLEYPAGTFYPLTVGGFKQFTLINGKSTTDDFALDIPANTNFWVNTEVMLSLPPTITATPNTTGGTFAAGTEFYKVTALTANQGESGPSTEISAAVAAGGSITLALTANTLSVANTGYNIYRSTTTGTEVYYATVPFYTTQFTDTNAFTPGTAGPPVAQSYPVGVPLNNTVRAGEAVNYSTNAGNSSNQINATGNTSSSTTWGSATSGNAYGPSSVVGIPDTGYDVPIVSIMGDTLTTGLGATAENSFVNYALINASPPIAYWLNSSPLESAATVAVANAYIQRYTLTAASSDCVASFGTNDLANNGDGSNAGTQAVNIEQYIINMAVELKKRNCRAWQTTILPVTSYSSDNWTTTTNQYKFATTLSNATNANPIVITVASTGNLQNSDQVIISGVTGNTNAVGTFYVKVLTATTFSLYSNSTLTTKISGNASYISGGIVSRLTAENNRIAVNYWLRNGAPITISGTTYTPVAVGTSGAIIAGTATHPLSGVFDIDANIEVNSANTLTIGGGLWFVNGTASYYTTNGINPTAAGVALLAPAISTTGFLAP